MLLLLASAKQSVSLISFLSLQFELNRDFLLFHGNLYFLGSVFQLLLLFNELCAELFHLYLLFHVPYISRFDHSKFQLALRSHEALIHDDN